MGAASVGATIYFSSGDSRRKVVYVSEMFKEAHALGMVTVLWCYIRNNAFKTKTGDHHNSACVLYTSPSLRES